MDKLFLSLYISPLILFSQSFNGMTLFSPVESFGGTGGGGDGTFYTYLINNDMDEINTWTHPRGAASMPYLLPDSTLIYPYRVQNPSMVAGGVGGGIQRIDWNGNIRWEYIFSDSDEEGRVPIEITYSDSSGNIGDTVTLTTNNSYIVFDNTPPSNFTLGEVNSAGGNVVELFWNLFRKVFIFIGNLFKKTH